MTSRFAEIVSEAKGKQTAKVVGGSAAIGAYLGAITKGKKGAAIGAAAGAGAGAAVQVLRGKRVYIPSESLLAFPLEESVTLNGTKHGAAKSRPTTKYKKATNKAEGRELRAAQGRVFGERLERIIRDWFSNKKNLRDLPPGLAKREQLPPGLQRQLRKNGTLSPGLQKRIQPLPRALGRLLPRLPTGVRRGIIGSDVVLVEKSTNRILDIVADVLSAMR